MRVLGLLSTAALTKCWADLEESSLLQINHLDLKVGICTVSGDPHIKPFDSNKTSVHYYYNGDYYLVKSDFLVVQARYWSTAMTGKSTIKALAIGGNIMEGSILTIEPQNGNIKLDGEVVNLPVTGSVAVGSGVLTSSADAGAKKKGPLVTLRFANDDVTIKAKRMPSMMNAIIEMRPEKDQDGHCGNFNGNVNDDTLKGIKARMGKPLRYGETMFPIMSASLRGCAPKEVGQEAFGEVFGKNMNVNECNMMCSQRGTPWMALKDGVCSCAASAPSVTASAECEASCDDSYLAGVSAKARGPGPFCAYELAKPTAVDATACALNEAKVVKACTAVFAQSGTAPDEAADNIESCKIDACSTGDLAGTLAYLQDWGSVQKKERMKLKAQRKKERALGETNRKEKGVKRKAAHAAKKEKNSKKEADKKALRKQRKAAELDKKQKAREKKAAKKAAEKANKKTKADKKAATAEKHTKKKEKHTKKKDALAERKQKAVAKRKEKVEKTTERREKLTEKKTKRMEQLEKKKVSP